ncbi:GIY-YIG nuclease family protein [Dokdonella sp. MW10]|uniref:GIY-YIG nuclease family protein n=1 Tax=Dokdonella sp. MW10 TaxID=2992926 RepID=UPI003F7DEDD8
MLGPMATSDSIPDEDPAPWRPATRGRCYVYALPAREADVLKIGFARDPLVRMRSLHRRFHAWFALERGLLIETPRVAEARAIERHLKKLLAAHATPAPLEIRAAAHGRTEWYRGAGDVVALAFEAIAAERALPRHDLAAWLRGRWASEVVLHDWAAAMLAAITQARAAGDTAGTTRLSRALRGVLEAFEAVDLALEGRVDEAVLAWHLRLFDTAT